MKTSISMKNIITPLISLLIFVSCTRDNFLDFQPKGVVIPSSTQDYRNLLDLVDGFSDQFDNLTEGFDERPLKSTFVTDDNILSNGIVSSFGIQQSNIRTYLFEDQVFTNQEDDTDWNTYYQQIYTANLILDGLTQVTDGSLEEIAILAAEARLHRAYAYFNLVNLYALHYDPTTANTDLGLPIREGAQLEEVDLTRVSVQETYDYMLNDIQEGLPSLEDVQDPAFFFRPSKAAAYGLLSKIYLYQGRYSEALEAVENALILKNDLRNINDDPISVQNDAVLRVLPPFLNDTEIIWYKSSFSNIIVEDEFVNIQYEANDIRREWFGTIRDVFGDDIDGVYYGATFVNIIRSNGVNTADLYLIRAECNARLGNLATANTDLNTLRQTRYETGTYAPINITDDNVLLSFVKNERRRELVGTGERMFDIKRYNRFDNDNISLIHTIGNRTETLPANSNNWALPIAERIIQFNPEIEQNPRN